VRQLMVRRRRDLVRRGVPGQTCLGNLRGEKPTTGFVRGFFVVTVLTIAQP
jgi:hypothetical protein